MNWGKKSPTLQNFSQGARLLDEIKGPRDLNSLSRDDLRKLAQEIRDEILTTVSEHGGHLASSLGVVELAIALHYVFDTPEDKIIWDVGHQSYPHKLITERRDRFKTIRQYQGISGFPRRDESPYDAFGTGHASTSISAALGMAEAMMLAGKPNKVVAVIGDGGLTGGMALEALTQTPRSLERTLNNIIVILNDNEMSIAPSVGSFSTLLSQIVATRPAMWFTRTTRRLVRPLPEWLQRELSWAGRRWRQSFLGFFTPGILIEAMGYHYLGPVDGHRIEQLISILRRAKKFNEPILIHVLTKKGKGYTPAEDKPMEFHGTGPFNLESGDINHVSSGPPTYTGIFSETMIELFKMDSRLIGITAAMPQGTGLDKVYEKFPDRVFDMGITEQHCVTFAAGMACEGYKPVAAIYSTFLQRAYDQILHDVCLQNLPVIFCLDRAGIVGEDGPTHHGLFDLSYLRHLPNMTVMAPKDENELRHMLFTATQIKGPVAIRYPRGRGFGVALDQELKSIPHGKAEILCTGEDLVIIALGNPVIQAVKAAEILAEKGISATVVNARFAKPLDETLILELAGKVGRMVTIEENALAGGFGSAVLELMERAGYNHVFLKRIGIPDEFVQHGPQKILREKYGLDAKGIARQCMEFLSQQELLPEPVSTSTK